MLRFRIIHYPLVSQLAFWNSLATLFLANRRHMPAAKVLVEPSRSREDGEIPSRTRRCKGQINPRFLPLIG